MISRLDRYIAMLLIAVFLLLPALMQGTAYQTHKVRKGDTLYALSKRYNVSVDNLIKLNGLPNSNLSIGQVLKIKAETPKPPATEKPKKAPAQVSTPPPSSESSSDTTPPENAPAPQSQDTWDRSKPLPEDYFYIVKPKDNLYRIAIAHGISLRELLEWNGYADEKQLIRQGDKIVIKNPVSSPAIEQPREEHQAQTTIESTPAAADSVLIQRVYIVQKKDTLFKIASENGMTVEELKRINNLSSNDISVGQKLNLVTPRGKMPSEPTQTGLTEEIVRTRDKIRSDLFKPVEGRVISEYGIRNGRPHKGIDIGAKTGTPIYAVLDGTVVFSGYQGAYGNVIVMEHPDFVMTVYAHNEKNIASVGDTVKKGELIGTVGATGNANGSHLHFEYRIKGKAINPRKVLPLD